MLDFLLLLSIVLTLSLGVAVACEAYERVCDALTDRFRRNRRK